MKMRHDSHTLWLSNLPVFNLDFLNIFVKKGSVRSPRCAREDNIKMDNNTAECESVQCIQLIHNQTRRWAFKLPPCYIKGGRVL